MTRRRYQAHKSVFHLALAGAVAVSAVPVRAQDTVTPIEQAALPSQAAPGTAVLSRAQIEAMLAPIALYPDQLLTQILMAAAYPQEVADADRWVKDPAHANLNGEQLAAELAPIDWDPSVKSLVPFPQVLATMAEHLDWTEALGATFVAQQADVLDAVQRLRRQAQAAGYLRSTPQMTVVDAGGVIVIEPADPTLLYVPTYDPGVIYGAWPYAAYPPVVIYQPPPTYYYDAAPIVFGVGFVIVRSFWNWHGCDWRRHRVWVDPPRFNSINATVIAREHRRPIDHSAWQFDPHHRRSVAAPAAASAVAPPPTQSHRGTGGTWQGRADPPPATERRGTPRPPLPAVQSTRPPMPLPSQPSAQSLRPPQPPAQPAPRSLAVVPAPPAPAAPHTASPAPHPAPSAPLRTAPPAQHFAPPAPSVRSFSPVHAAPPPPPVHSAPPMRAAPSVPAARAAPAAPPAHPASPPPRSSSDRRSP